MVLVRGVGVLMTDGDVVGRQASREDAHLGASHVLQGQAGVLEGPERLLQGDTVKRVHRAGFDGANAKEACVKDVCILVGSVDVHHEQPKRRIIPGRPSM